MKLKATMKDWKISNKFTMEGSNKYQLIGVIVDDEQQRNFIGKIIHTSHLTKIDFIKKVAETKNTIYKLI